MILKGHEVMFVRFKQPAREKSNARRSGAVLVENALVSGVFGLFMAGVMEFGHAYMVMAAMNAATQRSARQGTVEGTTTAQVKQIANTVIGSAFKSAKATVVVKNAQVFDTTSVNPSTVDYGALPDIELEDAEMHQLFVVRVTVPYNSVALLPPFWVKNLTLKAQTVMRHE